MKLGELRELTRHIRDPQAPDAQQLLQAQILKLGLDPNMLYQELEMTSRFVDTHRDISYSNGQLTLHSHAFYELIFCCNSCGAEYLVGSERYRIQQGDVIFVPPGVSHRPLLPDSMSAPYSRYVLWLSQEFMDRFAQLLEDPLTETQAYVSLLRTRGTPWETLGELFANGIAEAEARDDGWEAALIGNTITLLTQIKRATDARSARRLKAENPELLDRIMAYVEENYPHRITTEELGRHFYVSSSTVSHLFKQKMGISFYRYVTQRRLIEAKKLIQGGHVMEDVSRIVGFSDYSTFYRAFKQEFGISPRQFAQL